MITADRVRSAAEAVERHLHKALSREDLGPAFVAEIQGYLRMVASLKGKLDGRTPEQLRGAGGVLQGIFRDTNAVLGRYGVRTKAPAAGAAPIAVAAPVPAPVAVPEEPEPVVVPVKATIGETAAAVAALADIVNPPLSADRVQAVINSTDPVAADLIRMYVERGFFAVWDIDKGPMVVMALSRFAPAVASQLEDASLAVVQTRIQTLLGNLSREIIAPLSIEPETADAALQAAETVTAIRQALALAPQGVSEERELRHALRKSVLDPLLNLVRQLAAPAAAPLPTPAPPMDVTAPEDAERAEALGKAGVSGPDQAVGSSTQPSSPAPPAAEGFVLWVPLLAGDDHFAVGGGGVPVGQPGFAPIESEDVAKLVAKDMFAVPAMRKAAGAPGAGWERRLDFANYRIEPYAPQLDPAAKAAAVDEDLPDASALVSMLDQFNVPEWYDPMRPPEPEEALELRDYLDTQFGYFDWTDLLDEAVRLRREVRVEGETIDRCVFWTRNPGSYTDAAGAVVTTDYEGTKRLDSAAVNGKTWYRTSMLCSEAEVQIKHWQAVAPHMSDPEYGRTLAPADFDKLLAAESAEGTEAAPITPDRTEGRFQIAPNGVWIDAGALTLLVPTTYSVETGPFGIVHIKPPDGSWFLQLNDDPKHVLAGATRPVFRVSQIQPTPTPGHELDAVYAFLADIEARGIAKAVPGSLTTAEATTAQAQTNGGLTVGDVRTELIKVLTSEWLPWMADNFGVTFDPKVSVQPDKLVLNFLYTKDSADPDAPESFGVAVNFKPVHDEVEVEERLLLPENPPAKTVTESLGKAVSPLVLIPLLAQHQAFRPPPVDQGALTAEADVRVNAGRDRAYAKAILDIAETRLNESRAQGARGESIE